MGNGSHLYSSTNRNSAARLPLPRQMGALFTIRIARRGRVLFLGRCGRGGGWVAMMRMDRNIEGQLAIAGEYGKSYQTYRSASFSLYTYFKYNSIDRSVG